MEAGGRIPYRGMVEKNFFFLYLFFLPDGRGGASGA
jgi:hypothetical protein